MLFLNQVGVQRNLYPVLVDDSHHNNFNEMSSAHEVVAVGHVHAHSKAVVDLDDDLIEVYDSAKHHRQREEVVDHNDDVDGVEQCAIVEHQTSDENNRHGTSQLHTVVQFHSEEDLELDAVEHDTNISYQVFGTI